MNPNLLFPTIKPTSYLNISILKLPINPLQNRYQCTEESAGPAKLGPSALGCLQAAHKPEQQNHARGGFMI
jgi:hypothetical protein